MAQMLQALKNLEARSPRPAGGVLAHLADATPATPCETQPNPEPIAKPAIETPIPRAERSPPDVAAKLLDRRLRPPHAADDLPIRPAPPSDRRVPTSLEDMVLRTLSDAARLTPIQQMADRLLADARQSSSQTLLLAGIGPTSSAHQALLYAGALLAKQADKVLLIDADASRRALTTGMECGDTTGLSELLSSRDPPRSQCLPTSFEGLWLLPTGRAVGLGIAASGSRFGELLHELSGDFTLILLDGGRCADSSASTLARLCDATYLVVPLGSVEASEAQSALRRFRAAGARVLGCIAT